MFVINPSIEKVIWIHINVYTVENVRFPVTYVINHSIGKVISKHMNSCTGESIPSPELCNKSFDSYLITDTFIIVQSIIIHRVSGWSTSRIMQRMYNMHISGCPWTCNVINVVWTKYKMSVDRGRSSSYMQLECPTVFRMTVELWFYWCIENSSCTSMTHLV
jgi:hypothetical protein